MWDKEKNMEILKFNYEKPLLEFISISKMDIMSSSAAFDGEDDVFDMRPQ